MQIDQAYVDRLVRKVDELEGRLADPAVAADPKKFQALLAEHARGRKLRDKASKYYQLVRERDESTRMLEEESDPELREMAQAELDRLELEIPAAEKNFQFALLPPDPVAERNVIMEVRAGTGGDEAALFAGDLYRMYTRFAENRGWKASVLDASPTDLGGYKEIIFSIEGKGAYEQLRFESGGHRVQRIPVTEAGGRIHTSAATVAVLPEAEPVDDIEIKPDELQIDVYRASGAGGQHVNTTDSAVRITHLPSGIVVQSQDERSQHRNREKAMRVLMARLLDRRREEEESRMASERKLQIGSGDRSQRIRTYNFPQNRVTDHRINLTLYSLERLMEGELDDLSDALVKEHLEERLAVELDRAEA